MLGEHDEGSPSEKLRKMKATDRRVVDGREERV